MNNNKRGNYARYTAIWDREDRDRSDVIDFYSRLAEKYGQKVLCLMCAVGTIACGLAEKGFSVTAVDIEPEMIAVAKKNNTRKANPLFLVGDVTDLHLPDNEYDFAFIGGSADFHHLLSEEAMLQALSGIYNHLNEGCLVLELEYPSDESWNFPEQRFDLEIPSETGIKAWKYGETSYDAGTMLMHIKQEVFIEEKDVIDSFIHEFDFQLISHETMESLMRKTGFQVVKKYGDYNFSKWHHRADKWILEAVKVKK
jgi:SAM-dependent methyltransferase